VLGENRLGAEYLPTSFVFLKDIFYHGPHLR